MKYLSTIMSRNPTFVAQIDKSNRAYEQIKPTHTKYRETKIAVQAIPGRRSTIHPTHMACRCKPGRSRDKHTRHTCTKSTHCTRSESPEHISLSRIKCDSRAFPFDFLITQRQEERVAAKDYKQTLTFPQGEGQKSRKDVKRMPFGNNKRDGPGMRERVTEPSS